MIKGILKQLASEDYEAIMEAFDTITPHVVDLDDDKFIGVHVELDGEEERQGFFSYGTKGNSRE